MFFKAFGLLKEQCTGNAFDITTFPFSAQDCIDCAAAERKRAMELDSARMLKVLVLFFALPKYVSQVKRGTL